MLEAKLVITAEDRASKAIAAIEKRIAGLSAHFTALNRLAGGGRGGLTPLAGRTDAFGRLEKTQARLAASIDRMTRAVERLDHSTGKGGGSSSSTGGHGGGFGALHALGFGAGFEAAEAVGEIKKASFDRVHQEARMTMAGMTADEIAKARQQAVDLAAEMPSVSANDILHESRNARSVLGSSAEAAPLMRDLVRLRVIAQAQKPGQDITQDMDLLVKGLEIGGVTQDPKKFHEYMNGVARGISVFGDTLSAKQYYDMFKYGRQATPMLSEKFILGTAPTLSQELGGSSYGKAVSAFNRAIVSGRMSSDAAKALRDIGLVGKDDLDKHGMLKHGKSVSGWALAQTDPNAWIREYLLPAMKEHGITDVAAIGKEIGTIFSNGMAAQMASILALQQGKIDKDLSLIQHAKGLEGADYAQTHDPTIAFGALRESLSGLGATLGESTARALAPVASDLSKAIGRFSASVEKNNQWRAANGYDKDSPQTKETRRAFNKLVFGVDSDKGIGDVSPAERLGAEFASRREQLRDRIKNSRITDPKKLLAIEERRKHTPAWAEASSKMMDDAEEYPGRYAAQQELAALDAQEKAYRDAQAKTQAELDRVNRALRFTHAPAPDAPTSPYIYGGDGPTDSPVGLSVFPTTKRMGYGKADVTSFSAPPVAPPAPVAPPPADVNVLLGGSITAEPLVVKIDDGLVVKAIAAAQVGLRAEIEKLRSSTAKANVGTSLPEAGAGSSGANGTGRQ